MAAKILHIILASLIYLSSAGLVLNQHFCRNQLKEVAFFVKARNCHDVMAPVGSPPCPMHGVMAGPQQDHEKGCCDDTADYLKVDQPQSFELPSLDVSPVVLTVLVDFSFAGISSCEEHSIHYLNYKPPLIVCDRPALLQTFLC